MSKAPPRNHAPLVRQLVHGALAQALLLLEQEPSASLAVTVNHLEAACASIAGHERPKLLA